VAHRQGPERGNLIKLDAPTAHGSGSQSNVGPSQIRSRRTALVKAGITVVVVLLLLLTIDVQEVARALRDIPQGVLIMVLALLAADRVVMGIKWRHLVNGAGGHLRAGAAVGIYYQSGFAALLLPTSMGGEVLRAILGQRAGVRLQLLLASMVMEKLIAGVSNVALAVVGAIYIAHATDGRDTFVAWAVVGSTVVVAAALAVASSRSLHRWIGRWAGRWIPERGMRTLDQFSAAVVDYRERKPVLGTNLMLNVAEHLLQFSALYLLALGLGINFGLLPFFAVTAVVMLVRRTVGFLESWWLAETAMVVLYSLFGVPQALSVGLAFALWGTSIVAALPGAYLLYRHGLRLGGLGAKRA
jgi:glycosyltransferase 2 family protein